MFPSFIPPAAQNLTEATSIALAQQIERHPIEVPFTPELIPTSYVSQGSGTKPIVLLHGFDSSVLEFRRLLPLLGQQKSTWAVDLWGFGFNPRLPGLCFSAKEIKSHLHSFWQNQINQPVTLVGASMGGATAIDFTLTYPEAVSELVLLDSAGLANPPFATKLMFPPWDRLSTEFLRQPFVRGAISRAAYYDKSFNSPDAQLCAALHLEIPGWSRGLISFTKSGGYGSFLSRLGQIRQPTLILWGEEDKILGTKDAQKFAQAIANSKLIWVKSCGHVPHLEQPQIAAQAILSFLWSQQNQENR